MQRARLPFMLAVVTFALSLVAGLYAYQRTIRTVPALVAAHDIPAGVALTPQMVQVVRIPAGGLPPKALYGPDQIDGMYTAAPLFEGQILTARHLSATPPAREQLTPVGPGQRIVSVPVKLEAALGGALRPGNTVDVVAAWPGQDGKPGPVEVLAAEVKVVDLRNAAGESILAGTGQGIPGPVSAGGALSDSLLTTPPGSRESGVPTAVLLLVSSSQAKALVGAVESKATIYLWFAGRGEG